MPELSSWTMMLAGAQRDAVVSRKRITHCVCEFNRKRKEHYANLRAVKEGVVRAVQVRCGGNDSTEEQKEFEVRAQRLLHLLMLWCRSFLCENTRLIWPCSTTSAPQIKKATKRRNSNQEEL